MFRFSVFYLFYIVVVTILFLRYFYKKQPQRWLRAASIGFGFLLLPPILYYGIWLQITPGTPVLVPNVIGLHLTKAHALIESVGLRIEATGGTVEDQQLGKIVEQSPKGDMFARKGSTVVVRLRAGSPWVKVPSVIGMSIADAEKTLRSFGLHLGTASPEAGGSIVYQYPAPGLRIERQGTVEVGVPE